MNFFLSNRMATLGAIGLMFFFAYKSYKQSNSSPLPHYQQPKQSEDNLNQNRYYGESKHRINLDSNKEPKDYTLTEKMIYKLFKKDIDIARTQKPHNVYSTTSTRPAGNPQSFYHTTTNLGPLAPKPTHDTIPTNSLTPSSKIGASTGDKLSFSYKYTEDTKAISYAKEVVLGKKNVSSNFENALLGMVVGEKRQAEVDLKDIDKQAKKNKKVIIEITLNKIN